MDVTRQTKKTVWAVCRRKVAYPEPGQARRECERLKRTIRSHFEVYRCPFAEEGEHWHVGSSPSMSDIKQIAMAIRDLHGNRPSTGVDRSHGNL